MGIFESIQVKGTPSTKHGRAKEIGKEKDAEYTKNKRISRFFFYWNLCALNSAVIYIYKENRSEFLIVQRPFDDEDLPNIWGLPAGSVKENESFKEAVIRSGREKLGIELKVIKSIGKDIIDRGDYILNMQE